MELRNFENAQHDKKKRTRWFKSVNTVAVDTAGIIVKLAQLKRNLSLCPGTLSMVLGGGYHSHRRLQDVRIQN